MNTNRTLRLRKEILAELADTELEAVAGAATGPDWSITCPLSDCLSVCRTCLSCMASCPCQ